jgi:hypothetical protein
MPKRSFSHSTATQRFKAGLLYSKQIDPKNTTALTPVSRKPRVSNGAEMMLQFYPTLTK